MEFKTTRASAIENLDNFIKNEFKTNKTNLERKI